MKHTLNRREFLKTQAAAAVAASIFPSLIPASARGADGTVAPSNRVTVGAIGVGPQGRGVMGGFLNLPDVRVVALCDVSQVNLTQAVSQVNGKYQNKDVTTYSDFRQLLARKDLDAVLIATPDHWHVPIACAAARAGKDMYVEKPMGLSIEEDQLLRRLCQTNKRIFQFGTQQRSSREFRHACELVRNGRIGKLKHINVWCSASRPGGSTEPCPVPEGLDYEFWLGPAPKTPYTTGKAYDNIPPGSWKTWWFNYDYALGFIAGWGVHPLDIAYWGHPAMMSGPMEVEGKAVIPTQGACNTSVAWEVNFKFVDGVTLRYRGSKNGYDNPSPLTDFADWNQRYGKIADHGTAFEGTEGWIEVHRGGLRSGPEKIAEDRIGPQEPRLINSANHQKNFVDSVKSRNPAICPIEDAVYADLLCHLSDISTRVDRKLFWDPQSEKFIKDNDANKKTRLRTMRALWKLG